MDGYLLTIAAGARYTVGVALGSLAVAIVIGLVAAFARLSSSRFPRAVASAYVTLVRGVPDLVLMLLVFYGGQMAANDIAERLGMQSGIDIDPLIAGIATIGVIYGAYLCETFRGAIIAIPKGQTEAGLACGLSAAQVAWRIVLPQMARLALPSFTNNWLVLVKATALVSIIGLSDMMYLAKQASGATHAAFIYFLEAGAIYLTITTVSLWGLRRLEARLMVGVRRVDH